MVTVGIYRTTAILAKPTRIYTATMQVKPRGHFWNSHRGDPGGAGHRLLPLRDGHRAERGAVEEHEEGRVRIGIEPVHPHSRGAGVGRQVLRRPERPGLGGGRRCTEPEQLGVRAAVDQG